MSAQRDRENAVRAGLSSGFFVLGASIVAVPMFEAGALVRLVLGLSAVAVAVLVGVVAYRGARRRGGGAR